MKGINQKTTFSLALLLVFFACGCGANEKVLRSGTETPSPSPATTTSATPEKVPFAKDLEDIRTAGFTFIYVLRRKDRNKIDADDRSFIRSQTTDVNRREMADDEHAVIVGSNFLIPAENIKALYSRFAVESYSPPPAAGTNTNAKK